MKPRILPLLALVALLSGCATTGTVNITQTATAIRNTLGPVVAYAETADASTIPDFQLASKAIGIMLNNGTYDAATLSAALAKVNKSPTLTLAVQEAIGLYSTYLASSVQPSADAKAMLAAFQSALDQGVTVASKAKLARSKK